MDGGGVLIPRPEFVVYRRTAEGKIETLPAGPNNVRSLASSRGTIAVLPLPRITIHPGDARLLTRRNPVS